MTAKKFRFNIIDAIILLVLIAAIGVLAYIFVISDDSEVEGEPHTVEYTIIVTSVNGKFKDSITEGSRVSLESNRKLDLGKVVKYEYGGSVKTEFNKKPGEEAAEVYSVIEDELIDMVITFRADTKKTEWGYCIDDEAYINVNNSFEFVVGDFRCVGVCSGVNVLDE
ncbi:MAG: DUF4330 family protein [Clostridia bacterium]|nr:DUF4330 family protein [Clostridia bacterium]